MVYSLFSGTNSLACFDRKRKNGGSATKNHWLTFPARNAGLVNALLTSVFISLWRNLGQMQDRLDLFYLHNKQLTRFNFVQKRQCSTGGHCSNMQVSHRGNFIRKGCELVKMSRKQTETLDLGGYIPEVVTSQQRVNKRVSYNIRAS